MRDFEVRGHYGSLVLVVPLTQAARDWVTENVEETAQWFGGALVVEPRYAPTLVKGMRDDGLEG